MWHTANPMMLVHQSKHGRHENTARALDQPCESVPGTEKAIVHPPAANLDLPNRHGTMKPSTNPAKLLEEQRMSAPHPPLQRWDARLAQKVLDIFKGPPPSEQVASASAVATPPAASAPRVAGLESLVKAAVHSHMWPVFQRLDIRVAVGDR